MIDSRSKREGGLPPNVRGARSRLWLILATLAAALATAGAVKFCLRPADAPRVSVPGNEKKDVGDAEFEARAVPNPGYVGAQACAACHSERVAECQMTNHYRTFRVPDPDVMPAGFNPGRGSFQTHNPSLRFEMTRAGDEFFQTAIHTAQGKEQRSDPTREQRSDSLREQRSTSRIDLVLGAGGKADEVYLTWRGDRLYELPMVWLFTFDKWGCNHTSPNGSGDFSRESTLRCLECHNTWFEHVPGSLNQYQPGSFLMGVTCENCHGPGRDHVAFHKAQTDGQSGQAIVRPARLSRERQIEVCTQCHSNAIQHKGPALNYRPGTPLADSYKTLLAPRHTEDDHVGNQVKYLRQSRCFQNSDEMTCTTCHNPHRPDNPAASGIESCRKCHNDADCREQPRLPEAVRTNCSGCHMPKYIKINVNFETEDDNYVPPIRRCDHRIAIHPRARQQVLLEWHRQQDDPQNLEEADRLTRSLVDSWLAEADACRRDYRLMGAIAALREAYDLDPTPAARERIREAVAAQTGVDWDLADAARDVAQQRYAPAIDRLIAIFRIKPDHAKAHGKLGTAYAASGQNELAIEHWQAVAKYDPDDPYGYSMLAWHAFLENRLEDALEAYRRADETDPHIASINYRWGLALAKSGRWEEAAGRFKYALSIDPNDAGACQGLGHALRLQGHSAEALPYARRAARLTQFKNTDVLLTLSDVYSDLQRFAEAADAASQALDAIASDSSELAPSIRRRLESLRARVRSSGKKPR